MKKVVHPYNGNIDDNHKSSITGEDDQLSDVIPQYKDINSDIKDDFKNIKTINELEDDSNSYFDPSDEELKKAPIVHVVQDGVYEFESFKREPFKKATIVGQGPDKTTITVSNTIEIKENKGLSFVNVTVIGSKDDLIKNHGNFSLINCVVENITAQDNTYGYIENYGNVTINNTIMQNISFYSNAIINDKSTKHTNKISINNSTFINNHVRDHAGLFRIRNSNFTMENSLIMNHENLTRFKELIDLNNTQNATIRNTQFISNKITTSLLYVENTTLTVDNVTFINNKVKQFSSCICAIDSNIYIYINNSVFENNTSIDDIGGAITAHNSNLYINNTNFTGNSAKDGGSIVSFNGTAQYYDMIEVPKEVIIENSNFINNTARNYGGAIYNEYTKLKINNTNFKENKAQNITTLYAYNANITQQNTKYTKNTALIACDIYMPFSTINETNITYTNNNSVIKRYIVKRSSDENNYDTSYQIPPIIPSHYNSADYGYVTPSKDQIESGNCWAFASLSTLETCYIKATGKTIDLSVNNMKNLMTLYSKNGWNKLPNTGAFDDMQISYLINWLGPVLDDDKYNTDNHISSELENVIQVNYIYGVPIRSGPLDNEQLKKAVMRYGAVYTTVYVSDRNHNIYRNDTSSINHAVSIIGWDDNYSRENFKNKPAGDGAFIVKNSWGISKTTSEYYYVSYYDTTILTGIDNMIECGGITFKFDNEI